MRFLLPTFDSTCVLDREYRGRAAWHRTPENRRRIFRECRALGRFRLRRLPRLPRLRPRGRFWPCAFSFLHGSRGSFAIERDRSRRGRHLRGLRRSAKKLLPKLWCCRCVHSLSNFLLSPCCFERGCNGMETVSLACGQEPLAPATKPEF